MNRKRLLRPPFNPVYSRFRGQVRWDIREMLEMETGEAVQCDMPPRNKYRRATGSTLLLVCAGLVLLGFVLWAFGGFRKWAGLCASEREDTFCRFAGEVVRRYRARGSGRCVVQINKPGEREHTHRRMSGRLSMRRSRRLTVYPSAE